MVVGMGGGEGGQEGWWWWRWGEGGGEGSKWREFKKIHARKVDSSLPRLRFSPDSSLKTTKTVLALSRSRFRTLTPLPPLPLQTVL